MPPKKNKIEIEFADIHAMAQASEAVSLIMKEKDGNRYIPVIIGVSEARAILLEVNKVKTNRPLTHELFVSLADSLHCNIVEVDIIHYKNGIFFADILLKKEDNRVFHLDARPSDAIALAIRSYAPIFMNRSVFEENCMTEETPKKKHARKAAEVETAPVPGRQETVGKGIIQEPYIDQKLTELPSAELHKLLSGAIDSEDYELAAKIQEELNRRKT